MDFGESLVFYTLINQILCEVVRKQLMQPIKCAAPLLNFVTITEECQFIE